MEILSVDGLHAAYGRIPVLHGIDLSIEEGEFTGVLGHNGMGKTTLLKTLIGVLTPTAGTIKFRGTDVTRKPAHQRNLAGLGYVAQGRDIFPKLSVLDNLRVGLVQHTRPAEERARIEAVLEDFPRLRPLLGRLGGVLSGGEQQILALARCLVGNPRLVMLDEPTEGIQPSIIDEIVDVLKAVRVRRGLTTIVVEQDLEFISALAERVLMIQRGRIIAEVKASQLTTREMVEEFVGMGAPPTQLGGC